MHIKKSVFGSKSEHDLFMGLKSRWSKESDLWPSLPFSSIVEIERSDPFLTPKELDFFYKTNIDYTLCTKDGNPILSIEFDGLGKGYNRNGEYIQIEKSDDPHRKLKLDFKIKLARKVEYPFFIVSFEESKELAPNLNLTIADGIIGQVLANRTFREKTETLYSDFRERIEALSVTAQTEYI